PTQWRVQPGPVRRSPVAPVRAARAIELALERHLASNPPHCLLPMDGGWPPHEFRRMAFDAFELIRQSGGDIAVVLRETAARGPDPGKDWRVTFVSFLVD